MDGQSYRSVWRQAAPLAGFVIFANGPCLRARTDERDTKGTHMIRTRIAATTGALALMATPAVALAHGDGHHGGKHHKKPHHHHVKRDRDVTGTASATVQSFADGALTIAMTSGRTYTADVTDKTVILCFKAKTAKAAGHGGDEGGKGKGHHGDDDATTTAPASTTVPPTTGPVKSQGARCGTDKLVSGAKVSVAKLSLKGDTAIWKKVIVVS